MKVVRYQSSQQVQLYDQELRAGKVSADLMFFVEPPLFVRLAREGKLTKYCSPNFVDYRPEALTPDCSYFYVNSYLQYLAYNPDLMPHRPRAGMISSIRNGRARSASRPEDRRRALLFRVHHLQAVRHRLVREGAGQ